MSAAKGFRKGEEAGGKRKGQRMKRKGGVWVERMRNGIDEWTAWGVTEGKVAFFDIYNKNWMKFSFGLCFGMKRAKVSWQQ